MKTFIRTLFLPVAFVLSVLFQSCGSTKDVVYFQDAQDFETVVNKGGFATKFKIDDVISINVSTLEKEASEPFHIYGGSSEGQQFGGIQKVDYLVDQEGNIDFPVIGKIKVLGLSPEELKVKLRQALSVYLTDPIINIRLRNFTVSVLGEVNRPGTYQINGERATIFEAIGLAGDLTIKGKRDNVLVIRDFDGTKVYNRINLLTKESLDSPVYYLTQNDIVYVEPNNSRAASSSLDNRATIAVSVLSILITSSVILLTRN